MDEFDFETLAIHAGENPDPTTGALRMPLHMATTFKLPKFGIKLFDALMMGSANPPFAYTRWGNPTLRALEERLSALEGAEAAVVTASGMAAVSALVLTFLSSGDHLIASEVCYAGSVELFGLHLPRFGIEVSLVNTSDLEQVRAALRPNTKMIYAETPANPILRIADIAALAKIAHEAGALLAVDSTWASPVLQKPIVLGADFVVHSLTKYLNGHGDALGGAVLGSRENVQRIRKEMLVHLGGVLSPFNAWLITRGLITLPMRMQQTLPERAESRPIFGKSPEGEKSFLSRVGKPSTSRTGLKANVRFWRHVDLPTQRRAGRGHHTGRKDPPVLLCHLVGTRPQPAVLLPDRYVYRRYALLHGRAKAPHPRVDRRGPRPRQYRAGKLGRFDPRFGPGAAGAHLQGVGWAVGLSGDERDCKVSEPIETFSENHSSLSGGAIFPLHRTQGRCAP